MTPHTSANGQRYWLIVALLLTVFPMVYLGVYIYMARVQWLIMSGMVFAALWLLSYRYWPWIFIGTIAARTTHKFWYGLLRPESGVHSTWWDSSVVDPALWFLGKVPEPFLIATGVLLLRRWGTTPPRIGEDREMLRLHIAALISSAALALKDGLYVLREGHEIDPEYWFLQIFMGHFVGIMVVTPLIAILAVPKLRQNLGAVFAELAIFLVPALMFLAYINLHTQSGRFSELLRLLMLAGIIVFTVRHDWRGAALAIFVTSLALVIEDLVGPKRSDLGLQTFIAIAGAMALLFGTALEQLRRRNADLTGAMNKIQQLGSNLRAATVRNVAAEERHRKHLAAELHDEFGQNLTALQTHLVVADHNPNVALPADKLLQITGDMRRNISRVLDSLRPLSLDELGLYASLDQGTMRHLCESAGISYVMEFSGDSRLITQLEDSIQITVFRFVQEAVTNVVRHSGATQCLVKLRVAERQSRLLVAASVQDDGIGRRRGLIAGNGLSGMRDRITALGGHIHIRDARPGIRAHILLPQQQQQQQ